MHVCLLSAYIAGPPCVFFQLCLFISHVFTTTFFLFPLHHHHARFETALVLGAKALTEESNRETLLTQIASKGPPRLGVLQRFASHLHWFQTWGQPSEYKILGRMLSNGRPTACLRVCGRPHRRCIGTNYGASTRSSIYASLKR